MMVRAYEEIYHTTLNDEELMELQRILLDSDREAALRFLKSHLDKKVRVAISGEGH